MDKSFFNTTKILDGGTGQELINKGLKPESNLWSATALIYKKYHQLIVNTHLDFIKAGAEVIVTNSFGSRKRRMLDNNILHKFETANKTAGRLAKKAVKISKKKIFIAGSLPPQNFTYMSDLGKNINFIKTGFYEQAKCLNPYVDFFYLDVMSSLKECEIGLKEISKFKKECLIGIHIRNGQKLPSGENFIDVVKNLEKYKPLGIIASCVSLEDLELVFEDIKKIKIPFGFKLNAFQHIPDGWKPDGTKPHELGKRKDITPKKFQTVCKKLNKLGATIIGGCCEITPAHIAKLKLNLLR